VKKFPTLQGWRFLGEPGVTWCDLTWCDMGGGDDDMGEVMIKIWMRFKKSVNLRIVVKYKKSVTIQR